MNFCTECGSAVIKSIPEGDNRPRYMCSNCNVIHYQNPKTVVGVLPTYKEQVLLCKRAIQPRRGFWTLPAGFHELGESTLEGALRECKEETNAEIIEPTLYAIFDIPQISQVYVFFRGEIKSKNFGPTEESLEVQLFNEEEIPWHEIAFPMVEVTLDRYFLDRSKHAFPVFREEIRRPWKSKRLIQQD